MGEKAWDYDKEVAYPFGYGLSYTTFTQELNDVKISTDGTITASVTVRNAGNVTGKSVVQLYAQSPYTEYDKTNLVEKSAIQLLNFTKTKELKGGESQTVEITASMEFLASYDYTKAKTYILDEGDYYFAIGDNAHDALNNVIAKKSSANSSLGNADNAKVETRAFDDTTYATSSITGNEITNLFDRADYNYFKPGSYTYLTRQDWTTFPTTEDYLSANTEMMKELSGQADLWDDHDYSEGDYDDADKITTGAKNDHDVTELYQNTDETDSLWDLILDKMTIEEMCTFTEGNSLTREIKSIGYEGSYDGDGPAGFSGEFGDTATDNTEKLTARVYQSQCMLASTWNQDLAYSEGSFMGEDGLYLGKTSIWAPGANLHRTPYSARNFEYYSEDSMMAYYMGAQQCKGLQDKGCIACPKHFAFNDQEKNRCSLITFINEQEARELQLRCFEGSFTVGGAMGTMTSFTRIGLTYAGESHALMTDILRGEWGFKGYTITDYAAWNFMHAVECIKAGTDLFDTTQQTYSSVLLAEMEKGDDAVLAAALRTANKRVLYAYVNSHSVEFHNIAITPWWKAAIYAVDAGLGSFTVVCGGVYISLALRAKRKKED
jgi:beta-glucosidase